tara:strand:+ start:678 stop:983 length:306 start_codon:yes stop_codon:yes gene_type:complete
MSRNLIAVRNPKWKTAKMIKIDGDGNPVLESDGVTYVSEVVNDSDGNPIKIIECECKWSHLGDDTQDWLPFTADARDPELHGRNLYADLAAGKHGTVADEE